MVGMKEIEVYVQPNLNNLLSSPKARIREVASVFCANAEQQKRIGELVFWRFEREEKQCFSSLKLVERIAEAIPEAKVTVLGPAEFIVEYVKPAKQCLAWEWGKAFFVTLTVFFGSAFTIMTFNKDASVQEIFQLIYQLAGKTQGRELEISYSIGLPIGILIFFNHFLKRKMDSDPTPLQIQMRQYEKDAALTILENAKREGKTEDGGNP